MHLKHSEYARQSVRVSEISTHSGTATGFVSFIVAYGSVAWFMAYVRRRGFVPFAIYRLIVGAAVLFWIAKLST